MEEDLVRISGGKVLAPTIEASFRSHRSTLGQQAVSDTAMVLNAQLIKNYTGNAQPIHDSWDEIMSEPKRALGVLCVLTDIAGKLATDFYPGGLPALVDYMIDQAVDS